VNSPAAVVFDSLSSFARECLDIADDAVTKAAALDKELAEAKQREVLILTKVASEKAASAPPILLTRVVSTVDRLVATDFVKRANRNATIEGIRNASREELFDILEKLASIAICPVSSLNRGEDGVVVEKAAGKTTDDSEEEDVWSRALREARDEVGA
jgi:hypothetical protein